MLLEVYRYNIGLLTSFANFGIARFILLVTLLAGVFLGIITDECSSLLCSNESHYASNINILNFVMRNKQSLNHYASILSIICNFFSYKVFYPLNIIYEGTITIIDYLKIFKERITKKIRIVMTLYKLNRQAQSKRHFLYLMFKHVMNQKIEKDEKEFQSYIDIKESMNHIWPFMLEVSNVKSANILCDNYECIPMSSYSYLDLIRDSRVQNAAIEAAKQWSTGNHGPRMLGGNTKILRDLESVVAKFLSRDDALLCATGYLACMSAIAAISTKKTLIFGDSRLHASLRAGIKLGSAKIIWFKHNDFNHCEKLVKKYSSKYTDIWMIVESVYSMDGDICNLPEAHRLCQNFNIKLIIDEAHGLGVLGKTGRGVEEFYNLKGVATLIVGTFSKSVASVGGFITGPSYYMKFMDFHAIGNVFSAPLTGYSAGAALESFRIIDSEPHIIKKAQDNAKLLHQELSKSHYWPPNYSQNKKFLLEGNPNTTVIPIIFPNSVDRVMRIATSLKKKGYMCSAVAYPACPLKYPRFRITSTSAYTPDIIHNFVKAFIDTCVEEEPSNIVLDI